MFEPITQENSLDYDRLVQDYEEEFAPLTGKQKGFEGKYSIDVDWRPPNFGYYWIENGQRIGFCIASIQKGYSDVDEFYIIPKMRKKRFGKKWLIHSLINFQVPGK